jgi:hypothetical protein
MDWFSDDMVSRGLDEAEVDGIFLDDLALLLSREPFAARFHLHRLGQNASWTFERNNIVEILRYAIAKAKGLELRMKATAMNDDLSVNLD